MENIEYRGYSKKSSIAASQNIKEREYWLNHFAGEFVKTSFPCDYKKTTANERAVNSLKFKFDGELFSKLIKLSNGSDIRLNIIMMTGLVLLLYKYTASKDIILGSPIYKQDIEGDFINTVLAVRNQVREDIIFKEFLLQVGKNFYEANQHQNYPIETLLYLLNIPLQETGDFPLFDIAILLENIHHRDYLQHINLDMIFNFLRTDQCIVGHIEYNSLLYKETTIHGIMDHFKTFLDEALPHKLDLPLNEIDILTEKEKKQLLYDFNYTQTQYPADKTIHELFAEQAERIPDHIALVGLSEKTPISKYNHISITYKELNEISDQLAHILKEKGGHPDTIMAIMMERCVGMVIGILGILKARGAYLPIDPDYPQERVSYMLTDSAAKILVTTSTLFEDRGSEEAKKIGRWEGQIIALYESSRNSPLERGTSSLSLKRSGSSGVYPNMQPAANPSNLAYVIYTSGTTGNPKGALIEHKNVVRLLFNHQFQFDFNSSDVWTLFHSYCFDFSIWEMYGALLYGGQLVVIPKMAARDLQRYLEILKEKKVTILNQTPSAFYTLMNLELKDVKKELNIRYIIFGGEALNPSTLKGWKTKYPETKLVNMYGITETTVHVTFKEIGENEIESNVSNIGNPIPTLSAYVMDKNLKLLPIGAPGELCVGGEGVGRGYLNKPGLTGEKFLNNPYKPKERLYRSGDLVRLSAKGELQYLGRIDEQIKIRGFRIELGEIETHLLSFQEIEEAVVISKENEKGDKYICAYIVPTASFMKTPDSTRLREYLSVKLPDYMIPSYFIYLKQIPLTSNGKIDRKVLPEPEIKRGDFGTYIAPRNEKEKILAEIWSEVLGIEKNIISIDSNFFRLGGHSLKGTTLMAKIHKALNIKVPLEELFKTPTIRGLADFMKGLEKDRFSSIELTEEKEFYRLSSAQKRIYVLQQMDIEGTSHNISEFLVLEGVVDKNKLEGTFKELIKRHDSLRTSFEMINEKPVQIIHENVEFEIEYYDLAAENIEGTRGLAPLLIEPASAFSNPQPATALISSFIRPFDLSQAPLLRVGLIKVESEKHILMVDMHHIIFDGISFEIFVKEITALYQGEELSPLKLQYKDYSEWKNSDLEKEKMERQQKYWAKIFEKEVPVLNLPTDYPRPGIQSFEGSSLHFSIGKDETEKLRTLIAEEEVTLYMKLLTTLYIFLLKISGQIDIVIGSSIACRVHEDLQGIIGLFASNIALRNYPKPDKTFKEFLREVKTRSLEAFENQEFHYEELVEQVIFKRDFSRNPLFDVLFEFHDMKKTGPSIPGITLKPYEYESKIVKLDLSLVAIETEKYLSFTFIYCTKLFKLETIEKFVNYFKRIVSSILENPGKKLFEIEIMEAKEREKKLNQFNDDLENE